MLPSPLFQRYEVTMRRPSVVGKDLAEPSEDLTLILETLHWKEISDPES